MSDIPSQFSNRLARWASAGPRLRWWLAGGLVWLLWVYLAGNWAYQREVQVLRAQALRELDVQMLSLRGIAQRYQHIPYTSAHQASVTALLKHPHDPALVDTVDVYLDDINRRVGADALFLLNKDGECISASNWMDPKTFKGEKYGFRPYFLQARSGAVGMDYAVGATSQRPGLFYANPVAYGEEYLGVMVIKVPLTDIETNWAHSANPLFLLDRRGIVILSSVPALHYSATRPLSAQVLEELQRSKQYGVAADGGPMRFADTAWKLSSLVDGSDLSLQGVPTLGQRRFLVKQDQLPEFAWTLMVTADIAPAQTARWVAMTIAVLSSGMLLLGGLYWRQRERRVRDLRKARRELEARVVERTRELAERDAFRKAMEDSLPVGMRARDLEGRVTYVNARLCEITGYAPEDLMGKLPPYPYWHPEEFEKHWRDNESTLKGQAAPTGYESRFRHRAGRDVYVMIYTAPLINFDGQHSGWMSSLVDITTQKKAEEQQQLQLAKMQHTGRMASMGEMASTLAHELGNPMMSISSFAATAKTYAQKGKQDLLIDTLREIGEQSERAAEIVRRIRGFVRQHTPGFGDCSVNDTVGNVLALLRPELRQQRTKVVCHLAPNLPGLQADRLLLEQTVLNLVVNAVQAMQDQAPAAKIIDIRTGQRDDFLFIQVSDRGHGISEEVADKLFRPFFTTKPEGLGLGLNICRTTVEAHRGKLYFENRPTGGTTFTVLLPLSP